ncbi:hypothetical protein Kisp01_70710 [Kineosporia sp. NBRC 101677]|nr:hypothetical protein Kisp01_70710 [Kineosporia sp. NBRC 101677]
MWQEAVQERALPQSSAERRDLVIFIGRPSPESGWLHHPGNPCSDAYVIVTNAGAAGHREAGDGAPYLARCVIRQFGLQALGQIWQPGQLPAFGSPHHVLHRQEMPI